MKVSANKIKANPGHWHRPRHLGQVRANSFLSQHQLTKYSDVSDMFPNGKYIYLQRHTPNIELTNRATVRGVDLFPQPVNWLPPNCIMEVDDILQKWTWRHPFDLIHMRQLIGAFTPVEWDSLFTQCYK